MTLRTKLLAILSLSIFLMFSGASIGLRILSKTIGNYQSLIEFDVGNQTEIFELKSDLKEQVQEWKNVLIRGSDPQMLEKYTDSFHKKENQIQEKINTILEKIKNKEGLKNNATRYAFYSQIRDMLLDFQKNHATMNTAYGAGIDAFKTSGFNIGEGDASVKGIDRGPTEELQKIAILLSSEINKMSGQFNENTSTAIIYSLLSMLLFIAISLFSNYWFMEKLIVKRTHRIVENLSNLSKGDFSEKITNEGSDELGAITQSIQSVQKNVGNLIRELNTYCLNIDTAAHKLETISEETIEGIQQQKVDTEKLSTAIQKLTDSAEAVSESASNAASSAKDADGESVRGRLLVGDTNNTIINLSAKVQNAADVINKLEQDSDNIGKVLDVIRGIAEQTNLLALNAAIEAARAGEQGRGFAVVADEVRTLAQRTQQSTQEIQKMIEDLQAGTQHAVQAMNLGRDHATKSLDCSQKAALSIEKITSAVNMISSMNSKIAAAATAQRTVVEDVNTNVSNIRNVSEGAAEASKMISTASSNLAVLSKNLKALVSKFTVQED